MVDIPGNASTTQTVTIGSSTINTLEVVGDRDWFKINLVDGQSITVLLNGVTLDDPYLRIRNSSGTVIFENDDIHSGVDLDSSISFEATYTGVYYIDVGAFDDDDSGDYQLNVTAWTPPPIWSNDQIAEQLASGYWNDGAHPFNVSPGGTITVDISDLAATGQNLAREALNMWSDITGLNFQTVSSGAQITFDDNEEGAWTENSFDSNGFSTSAHVNVHVSWLQDYGSQIGTYGWQTYVHEIGHALGLGHAGNYNETATYPYDALYQNDAWTTSVMSYFGADENSYFAGLGFTDGYALTPMVADILAVGQLYGLSTTTRSGDTVYGSNNNTGRDWYDVRSKSLVTIFDTGGVDTLDYSTTTSAQLINLNPETFSNVGTGIGNLSIARGTIIENAIGGSRADTLIGNSAANVLTGNGGPDAMTGGAGEDTFRDTRSGLNSDTITDFGAGDKIVFIDASLGAFTFNLTGNTLTYTGGSLTLSAPVAGTITASAAAGGGVQLTIVSNEGSDVLTSGAGINQLDGGESGDIYMIPSSANHPAAEIFDSGMTGVDEVRFSATGTAQTLTMFAGETGIERIVIGTGTGTSAVTTGLLAHNVDARVLLAGVTIVGNSGANTLTATAYADTLEGGNGEDRLYGGAGSDVIDGGRDKDIMYGGTGDDTYVIDHASDAPIEKVGEGVDTAFASVAHTLKANVEDLTMTGIYSIHGRGNELSNTMTGNSGSNRMWGLDGNDVLIGNEGNDRLDGGSGNDLLIGGIGNDIYYVDSAGDTITEGLDGGRDTVESTLNWTLGTNLEWLVLAGTSNIDGFGNALANVLRGNEGSNELSGLDGNDKIYAAAGNDTLLGGDGDDWLEGGAGIDNYSGGSGSDRFVFREGDFGGNSTSTADIVADFGDAEGDRIHLGVIDANSLIDGNQAFIFIQSDAFSGVAGQLRYDQFEGNTYVSGDVNGDGIADFMIRVNGLHALANDDFIF